MITALVSPPIHFESFLLPQCYKIQRITLSEFGNQICERAKKFDANILEQSVRKISKNPEDSCKVYCATKTGEPITKSWTYPDGTMCHNYNSGDDDSSYFCVNGRCEVRPSSSKVNSIDDKLCLSFVQKFSCNDSATNYFRDDQIFCAKNAGREKSTTEKSMKIEINRDYKGLRPSAASLVQHVVIPRNGWLL